MLDQILSWLVLVVPVLLGLLLILVPAKHEDERRHMLWRYILGVALIVYGGIAWWQQARFARQSLTDRDAAIDRTSKSVSASVSESVSRSVSQQYQQTIDNLNTKIVQLENDVQSQGKKVDLIGRSDIVTGKNPVKVEITNASSGIASPPVPKIEGIEILDQEPLLTSPYKDAPYGVKVIIQTKTELQPVKFGIECDKEVAYGEFSPGADYTGIIVSTPGRLTNSRDNSIKTNSWGWKVNDPKFVPETPWIVRLYGKEPLRVIGAQMFH